MSCLNNQNSQCLGQSPYSLIRSHAQQRQTQSLGQSPVIDVPNQYQNVSNNNESELVKMLNNVNKNIHPTKKLHELCTQITYKVLKFKTVKTKDGNKCIAEIQDPIDSKVFNIFLPERFTNTPPNNNLLGVFLNYGGMQDVCNGNKYHDINFSYLCPQY